MLNLQSKFSQLLFSTVRIECQLQDNSTSTGTAFFFTYQVDEQRQLPLLITNKHVVRGARIGHFYVHEAMTNMPNEPAPGSFIITMNDFEQQWFMHPDPLVDICVMPVEPLRYQAQTMGKMMFDCRLSETIIPDQATLENLVAIEDVVMVGYPIGLWDSTNNFPILRRGSTASHPATNFQGKEQGVVDMACFPGSSGSPILLVNEGGFTTPRGFTAGTRVYLLGVLFAGPQYKADGKIEIVEIPTHVVAISRTTIPTHLGYYVKSSAIANLKPMLLKTWNLLNPTVTL